MGPKDSDLYKEIVSRGQRLALTWNNMKQLYSEAVYHTTVKYRTTLQCRTVWAALQSDFAFVQAKEAN